MTRQFADTILFEGEEFQCETYPLDCMVDV